MSQPRAVIWGASGGIGSALVTALADSGEWSGIHAGYRTPPPLSSGAANGTVRPFRFDLENEAAIARAVQDIAVHGPVDLAIIATGALQGGFANLPEKSFAALEPEAMMAQFRVNAIGPALIAKHMIPVLPRDRRCVLALLSARVGSIGDNRLGGWHSYRASKAALNMLIANLAIEMRRTHPHAIVLGLHPGTVNTRLSAPFRKGVAPGKLFSPAQSAGYMLDVIAGAGTDASGTVLAWDGQRIVP